MSWNFQHTVLSIRRKIKKAMWLFYSFTFSFARRFWNQIFTCVSVKLKLFENSARSAIERYCLLRNLRSRANNCCVVNGVRGFLLLLCFLRAHFTGILGGSPGSTRNELENWVKKEVKRIKILFAYCLKNNNRLTKHKIKWRIICTNRIDSGPDRQSDDNLS